MYITGRIFCPFAVICEYHIIAQVWMLKREAIFINEGE